MPRVCQLVVLGLLISSTATAYAQSCSSEEKSHQFDFWIGEWEVTANDQVAGTNSIQPILDGCVLQEKWSGASGSAGSSLNFYNPQEDRWEQFWVWRNGTTIHTKGGYSDGTMILQGESQNRDGETVLNKISWYDNEDGTVRQHWEISKDDGDSWSTVFDGMYRRK